MIITVPEMWRSLVEYVPAVAKSWWGLAISVAAAAFAVVTQFHSGLAVPGWAAVVIAVGALVVAQFRAFHHVRIARDQTGMVHGLPVRLPGMVNEFSGGQYWPPQLGSYVGQDDDAFVVRVIAGPRHPQPAAQLTTDLKDRLCLTLNASPLEAWLQRCLRTASPWEIQSPSTHYVATLVRSPSPNADRSAMMTGYSQLRLPIGPQSLLSALVIDVVVRPSYPLGDNSRIRFSLPETYELCHVLIATALDAVAPAIFPMVSQQRRRISLRRPQPPIGPSIYLVAYGQKGLGDFIALGDLARVPGIDPCYTTTMGAIQTPTFQRLDTFAARDQLVRRGLTTILAASEFLRPEEAISGLSLAPETKALLDQSRRRRRWTLRIIDEGGAP